MIKLSTLFRDKFVPPDKNILKWFPGHMGKGMKQIEQKLKNVDCLVEVHDARIPISGRNIKFNYFSKVKPHILVYNKKDLADLNKIGELQKLKESANQVIFTNCKDQSCRGVKRVIPSSVELISKSDRYNRSEKNEYLIMIIGVPNVGKSSLINILRNKYLNKANASPVGAIAGITKSIMTKIKVCQKPLVYLLDTPGILNPSIRDWEEGLKLASVSTMQDHLVGPQIIADFLLFWLNKNNNFSYVNYLGLREPSDVITEVLTLTAVNLNKTVKIRSVEQGYIKVQPDLDAAAYHFISAFRRGEFGKVMLD
ncbi:mitochondrial GTPase 1 [Rhodnius prolixus]|uniref:Mitochondrial GTPase 1 n=2 Tax=Rhodnius TaxID=13248 RepID=R4G4B2_RHOPR